MSKSTQENQTAKGEVSKENGTSEKQIGKKSFVEIHGEWENRPISIMGVVKRFISQLSYGQDLTRISMPSEFLNPYSVLEITAVRYLTKFPILLEVQKSADPVQKMLQVLRWFFAVLVNAKMYKKPYNPVVGETHLCYIQHEGTDIQPTKFVGEQVTHHPPMSAMHLCNETEDITVTGNVSFGVKFWLNSVTVGTLGYLKVSFGKTGEEYSFNKSIPDLQLKNVVFGTRRMRWDASKPVEVVCAKTGMKAVFKFDQSGSVETVVGSVCSSEGTVRASFNGDIDSTIHYRLDDDDEDQVLHSTDHLINATIVYPPQRDEYPSLQVWRHVTEHIIANNMTDADKAKHTVEEDQRRRVKLGEDEKKDRKYFKYDEVNSRWVYKQGTLAMPALDGLTIS